MEALPYSPACDENRDPIVAILRAELDRSGLLLEIGSGTGQHAVYMAPQLPHLTWQCSDVAENLPGIGLWLTRFPHPHLPAAIELDVLGSPWPISAADAVYSANTAHIMHWPMVEAMFAGVGRILGPGGKFCLYGPFAFGGRHTGDSNRAFDQALRFRDPGMGVRDFDDLDRLARAAGLRHHADHPMPRDNRTLVWVRSDSR